MFDEISRVLKNEDLEFLNKNFSKTALAKLKKQADYEAGLEKAQKDIDYLASIPVANEADRSYLQEVINSVTSEINQNAFTDWSNLSVQKLTKKHISRLSNDPKIQNAVSSASTYKAGYKLAKESEEQNQGMDAANQYDWQKQLNPWLNSKEAGEKFNGRFIPFVDIWKGASKVAEEVPIEIWLKLSKILSKIFLLIISFVITKL